MIKRLSFSLFIALLFLTNLGNARVIPPPTLPTFGNTGTINLCIDGSYYLNPSTINGAFSSVNPSVATVDANGYVTGIAIGTTEVSLTTVGGTVIATIIVASSSSLTIDDPNAQTKYKFDNNPHGPIGGTINYVGYNGFQYSNQIRPINRGFYRASKQDGDKAGCPVPYYIIKCDACGGSVSQYSIRPQGTLTGSTINTGETGQLTYTSSNGGGPFTIIYQATGASPVTLNNISSTVAFNVATGTPTRTTTYNLINVTDESSSSSADFTGVTATITAPHYIGEPYGGGIVFYIDAQGAHGLIASTVDQGREDWFNASIVCDNYSVTIDGITYTDWYLPNQGELDLLFSKKASVGDFTLNYYWSSTVYGLNTSWSQDFFNGFKARENKISAFFVRAIRSF